MFPPAEPLDILDVGYGPGSIALSLAELGHRVTGIDTSPEMLRIRQQAADACGLTTVHLVHGRAETPKELASFVSDAGLL